MVLSISQQIINMNGNNPNKMIKALCIMVNGKMIKNVVEVNKYGEMDQFIKEHFKTIWQMAVGDLFIHVVMSMKEIGSMIRLKEKEFIYIQMARCTLENGLMINNTDMVNKNGSMDHNMKETFKMDSNKVMEFFFGLMARLMKDSFISIKLKATENMYGLMRENMKDFGKIIKCMGKGSLPGQMEGDMKANILLIKSKEKVFLCGQMDDRMTVSGKMVSKTVKEYIDLKTEVFVKVYGRMGRR